MCCKLTILTGVLASSWAMASMALAAPPATQTKAPPVVTTAPITRIPPFSVIEASVATYFAKTVAKNRDFEPNDIITQDDVAPLLAQLKKKGLLFADAKQILAKVPTADEFLVEQFQTPAGQQFMRRIAMLDLGYDRVDRLSRLQRGQQTVRDLIAGPDGDKMIEYMTTTAGGKELGRMLGAAPLGANFNAPTGRIYTVSMLLTELGKSHAAAVKAASKSAAKMPAKKP